MSFMFFTILDHLDRATGEIRFETIGFDQLAVFPGMWSLVGKGVCWR